MVSFLFSSLSSVPPPGSSSYISNALIITNRVALRLEDPVRIQFTGRQLPDERSPINGVEDRAVEAYNTFEQISDLEDSMYNPSKCLVQLDFAEGIGLDIILDVCRAIYKNKRARVYTVQRYNCYFYAQTVLLCTSWWVYDWRMYYPWLNSGPRPATERSFWVLLQFSINKPMRSKRSPMQESDMEDLQAYLLDMIYAHSARVARWQYKFLLRCNAEGVERDVRAVMNAIWDELGSSMCEFHLVKPFNP
ncbi:hypothetical protein B0J17DRAFT_633923 [Rhizoctonia solani]|nr:hypothetical protein B0J17DRAFT_633923 [Rhizoctonia solani]